ncbi:hypothetical protein M427DRAFT_36585 [Gonapodya prolifera JEL478]|uniref:Uncharacterized protein n=1 Tax=Gonapodya prolifera (strain JEL478) TaxID=1344416 RepID=A0A139A307_GONPJ|nr:hypothetical protein M427DRAFT_36585 [Gonapodya prolifera JEL478]|eukprot:KXS10763.1 hypothetical protein M427DRAFT_36585 [Gonapodya prolifera JEL478]
MRALPQTSTTTEYHSGSHFPSQPLASPRKELWLIFLNVSPPLPFLPPPSSARHSNAFPSPHCATPQAYTDTATDGGVNGGREWGVVSGIAVKFAWKDKEESRMVRVLTTTAALQPRKPLRSHPVIPPATDIPPGSVTQRKSCNQSGLLCAARSPLDPTLAISSRPVPNARRPSLTPAYRAIWRLYMREGGTASSP